MRGSLWIQPEMLCCSMWEWFTLGMGTWHSPDTKEELQTKTQNLPSLGKFKALDTSSQNRACEEIKSQIDFSQIQGRLFLALFPTPSPVHVWHTWAARWAPTSSWAGSWCLHLVCLQPGQQTRAGWCRAPCELGGSGMCASWEGTALGKANTSWSSHSCTQPWVPALSS